MNSQSSRKQTTAERAYILWEQAGRPAGRDQEFWLRAEAELAAAAPARSAPPVIPPALPAPPVTAPAAPAHQIPPPLKPAVKTRRRAPR